jgi:hypothetical protein
MSETRLAENRLRVAPPHEDPAFVAYVDAGVDPGLRWDDVEKRRTAST